VQRRDAVASLWKRWTFEETGMNVGIVIVSHSPKIAEGAADMVRQMVGTSVPVAWTGGNPDGGLGTDIAKIVAAIDEAWSPAGVAVLVDLGGAETNAEMAIEMLDPARRKLATVCSAPIVEGAVIAATEASGGSSLETVKRMAEELSPQ
jgi:phosphoenolpyruvate---glycerone phosphotransferase subunit DhaM